MFWVKSGKVYTPSINTGILHGITRKFIISVLSLEDVPVEEGFFLEEDLLSADEVFITNSIQEIVSLTEVNEKQFNQGELTKKLQQIYNKHRFRLWNIDELGCDS